MTQPKKRSTTSPDQAADASRPVDPEDENAEQSLPEILEVFGAAPLVHDTLGFVSGAPSVARDAPGPKTSAGEGEKGDAASGGTTSSPAPRARDASGPESTTPPAARPPEAPRATDAPRAPSPRRDEPSPASPWRVDANAAADASRPSSRDERGVLPHELSARLETTMAAGLTRMRELVGLSEQRLGKLEASIDDLAKQTSFLPGKLRGLGTKVDSLTGTLGDQRCRGLLEGIVSALDLVEGAQSAFPADGDEAVREPRRYFDTIATRLRQILEDNQLQVIPTDVPFDPALHHALQQVPVGDADQHGRIVDVFRRGWRSSAAVLRFADVSVGRFDGSRADGAQVPPPTEPKDGGRSGIVPRGTDDRAIPVHELDPGDLDALVPPPGPPRTVTTDQSSISFRPTPPKNDRGR